MCLAVPSRIVEIDNLLAVVDVYGARKEISLLLMPEETRIGDYVLVHAGFAIQKVDEDAAQDALNLIREIAEAMEQEEFRG
ncbi:MAG: hydrogenase assembly protein HypC [Nitrospirae bacterium GWC2_46_6]|nr:MAG: hydrogenase assembly protein HypC [Nitrospirae bacterium GWC2_46_6]OGW21857.1 MAG: hydrogenase assembly protein HypC [Nitrospirae bacterium GWA2_46_11]OGW25166.1 MAG: hydrogenase assembly protein HypC [Nitrospirae bacterium GWB2_47_37]